MQVLITGATGLIGKELGKQLFTAGHTIYVITRQQKKAALELPFPCHIIEADLSRGTIQHEHLEKIEAVFHLAGENVGEGRWNAAKKQAILKSRLELSKNLLSSLSLSKNLKIFVAASAIGFYGDQADKILDENSPRGTGFLAELCEQWEASIKMNTPSIRTVIFRLGVVLSPAGGALTKMLPAFKWGVGGALGNGKQWMSWIHINDLTALMLYALENQHLQGVYNAVAPEPVSNKQFSQILASSLGKKLFLPVPSLLLRLVLGEMSQIMLGSQRVSCQKLIDCQFSFKFPHLQQALLQICNK